jgi:hypothetical protein
MLKPMKINTLTRYPACSRGRRMATLDIAQFKEAA